MSAPDAMTPDLPGPEDAYDPEEMGPRPRSHLALASLILSVVPGLSLAAPILGMAALVGIRRNPKYTGAPLAWAGIVVGTIVSALVVGMAMAQARAMEEMIARPGAAMEAAFRGDADGFRAAMTRPGCEATRAQVAAWVAPLRTAMGELRSLRLGDQVPQGDATKLPEHEVLAAYVAEFERGAVPVRVLFELPHSGGSGPVPLVRRMRFDLPDGTRIVFPDDEPDATPKQPAADGR
ncbi:MAG: DUF4190 domain-containing protein [Phycisphaerales bacterium]